MSELYKLSNYLLDIPFIFSDYIREYDISKANINILYKQNMIDNEMYNYLYNLPRMDRQYIVGNMCKDKITSKALENGLIEARKMFFETNKLQDSDILSIKKDAIFIINKLPKFLKFDNIEFIYKNTYTSYMKLNKRIEFYYELNMICNIERIDVKGINDKLLEVYHKNYMLDFICSILYLVQTDSVENIISIFNKFYSDYINKKLDIEYYREFNVESMYRIRSVNEQMFIIRYLDNTDYNKSIIDITYNLNMLRELYGYLTGLYFINNDRKRG